MRATSGTRRPVVTHPQIGVGPLKHERLELRRGDLPSDPGVGLLLASAYDMHTREGKMAIGRLATAPSLADRLAMIKNADDREAALHGAVFAVEGGRLDYRVSLPALDDIHFAAIRRELTYFGVEGADAQAALMSGVRQNLDRRNRHRQQIAGERFPAMIGNPRLTSGLLDQPPTTLPTRF